MRIARKLTLCIFQWDSHFIVCVSKQKKLCFTRKSYSELTFTLVTAEIDLEHLVSLNATSRPTTFLHSCCDCPLHQTFGRVIRLLPVVLYILLAVYRVLQPLTLRRRIASLSVTPLSGVVNQLEHVEADMGATQSAPLLPVAANRVFCFKSHSRGSSLTPCLHHRWVAASQGVPALRRSSR